VAEITKLFAGEDYKLRYATIREESFDPLPSPTKLDVWFRNEDAPARYISKIRKMDYRASLVKHQSAKPELRGYVAKIQILPKMSGKRWAVKTLLKKMGPNAKEVYAVGDGENDIRMLELLGDHGFAIAGSAAAREVHQTVDSVETLIAKLMD
jgi:hydroxymethylpyrimidine pyrophosphatase-like HAD family hydrolase